MGVGYAMLEVPTRGSNGWDSWLMWQTEESVIENAKFMAEHLLPHGYDLVTLDEGWFRWSNCTNRSDWSSTYLDEYGRYYPAPDRVPSGFASISSTLDSLGIRFGVHVVRGVPHLAVERNTPVHGTSWTAQEIVVQPIIPRADNVVLNMTHPGAQAYLDDFVALLGGKGIRFLKIDFIYYDYPDSFPEIAGWNLAVERSGYPIQISLSPGNPSYVAFEAVSQLEHVVCARNAHDFWDEWVDVEWRLEALPTLAPLSGMNGTFTDSDMLPWTRIGGNMSQPVPFHPPYPPCTDEELHCNALDTKFPICCPRISRFTQDEHTFIMALWCIARSPLIIGGNLPELSPQDLALVTNDDLLDMHARARNTKNIPLSPSTTPNNNNFTLYLADTNSSSSSSSSSSSPSSSTSTEKFVVLLNTGNSTSTATTLSFATIELPPTATCSVRDLIERKSMENAKANLQIPALRSHQPLAYLLSNCH